MWRWGWGWGGLVSTPLHCNVLAATMFSNTSTLHRAAADHSNPRMTNLQHVPGTTRSLRAKSVARWLLRCNPWCPSTGHRRLPGIPASGADLAPDHQERHRVCSTRGQLIQRDRETSQHRCRPKVLFRSIQDLVRTLYPRAHTHTHTHARTHARGYSVRTRDCVVSRRTVWCSCCLIPNCALAAYSVCSKPIESIDSEIANFMATLAGNIDGVVQYNIDNRGFEHPGSPGPPTIDDVCESMMASP